MAFISSILVVTSSGSIQPYPKIWHFGCEPHIQREYPKSAVSKKSDISKKNVSNRIQPYPTVSKIHPIVSNRIQKWRIQPYPTVSNVDAIVASKVIQRNYWWESMLTCHATWPYDTCVTHAQCFATGYGCHILIQSMSIQFCISNVMSRSIRGHNCHDMAASQFC